MAGPQPLAVPRAGAASLYSGVLLAVYSMALSLILAATNPTPASAPTPQAAAPVVTAPGLPQTQPGTSHDEGWFLYTTADDGSQAIYFIAGNTRHSIQAGDVQLELKVNPLWPMRQASQDEVSAFAEGAPIGSAKAGLLGGSAPAPADSAPAQPADPAPAPPAPAEPAPAPAEAAPAQPAPAPAPPAPAPAAAAQPAAPPAQPAPAPAEAAPAPADAAPAAPLVYVLRPGDNLTHIARDYGTTVDAILAANGVSNPNRIYAGQSLIIPGPDGATATADDTAPALAEDPTAAPAADVPSADAPSADADTESTLYTVKPGDSAFKIAQRFGVDQSALLEANGISNPNRVYIGQVLNIPT